jgi:alanyl-tRNA synthetase
MTSKEITERYIRFFKARIHTEIPSVSLVPDNDPTLLFVNSGMFPLVPYLSGEPHPSGKRLVNVQRSMRFEDIEEIGDNRHTTAFHMLGNWSLGDYFKKEQLSWIYEYFIKELNLPPDRLFASVFAGDKVSPKDTISVEIIKDIFAKYGIEAKENERIFAFGKADNWWKRGEAIGELGGPNSEIFYYLGEGSGIGKSLTKHPDEFLEIGNSVFMQYKRTKSGWAQLQQKNIDFGGGLERIALVVQKKQDIFETDNFYPIIKEIEVLSGYKYHSSHEVTTNMRIVADHLRASILLIMDGVRPSNKDQGYALRRFIRRMVRFAVVKNLVPTLSDTLVDKGIEVLLWLYPNLKKDVKVIKQTINQEEDKFKKTLNKALPRVEQILDQLKSGKKTEMKQLAKASFDLYQSVGYPPELFIEEARDKNFVIDTSKFTKNYATIFNSHQALSRKGAEAKFKGGLANHSKEVIKYHTTTHLIHQALRLILGDIVKQLGSNITNERLRFDFAYENKLTDQQILEVENLVNSTIKQRLPVANVVIKKEEADKLGALHFSKEKYPDKVKVYYIGKNLETAFSKEFCGGPHVVSLKQLPPTLRIYKQESVGKGIRRIYARFSQ